MSSIHQNEPIYVLSISANDQDHHSFCNIFGNCRWRIVPVSNLAAASVELQRHNVSVVVYDCDSIPEDWKVVLEGIGRRLLRDAVCYGDGQVEDGVVVCVVEAVVLVDGDVVWTARSGICALAVADETVWPYCI